ncbi:MAG: hypothetical protein GX612_05325 [Bacteroidales bacterium]|jgi:hypothetical protein|nr:hypothetical protein [Bacteroidales bacterium]
MSKEFKKEIEKGISAICNEIGFKKKQYYFIKPIDKNITATLSFGMALHQQKGHIFVNVGVGVSHKDIEQLYTELTGIDKSIFKHTINEQIGNLMPNKIFKEWDFVENADNTCLFEDLLKSIQTYGFPYQEKMSHFDNLFVDTLNKKHHANIYKLLSILYYLKGEKTEGWKIVEDALGKEKERTKEYEFPTQPFNPMNNVSFGKEITEKEKQIIEQKYMKLFTPEIMKQANQSKKEYINANFIDSQYGRVSKEFLTFIERYEALPCN